MLSTLALLASTGCLVCAGSCGCPAGEEPSDDGGCSPCDVGFIKAAAGDDKCTPCAPGSYASGRGAISCSLCAQGDFQPLSGQSTCSRCPGQLSSTIGSNKCGLCAAHFFLLWGEEDASTENCKVCPEGAHTSPFIPSVLLQAIRLHEACHRSNSSSMFMLDCAQARIVLLAPHCRRSC